MGLKESDYKTLLLQVAHYCVAEELLTIFHGMVEEFGCKKEFLLQAPTLFASTVQRFVGDLRRNTFGACVCEYDPPLCVCDDTHFDYVVKEIIHTTTIQLSCKKLQCSAADIFVPAVDAIVMAKRIYCDTTSREFLDIIDRCLSLGQLLLSRK